MKDNYCFIVGAGMFSGMSIQPQKGDLMIAADGGYTYLLQAGMEPDVLIGDFDSLDLIPEHRNLIRHSPIKDDTDMALAAAYGAKEGFRKFILYGGLGGRLDHTIANLMLLNSMARAGLEVYLVGEGIIITALYQERVVFSEVCSGTFSAFCLGESCSGVTEAGLKYSLNDEALMSGMTLGVSNEFTGHESYVEVKQNVLTIIWDEKNGLPSDRHKLLENTEEKAFGFVSEMGWRSMQNGEDELLQTKRFTGKA